LFRELLAIQSISAVLPAIKNKKSTNSQQYNSFAISTLNLIWGYTHFLQLVIDFASKSFCAAAAKVS